MVDEEDEEMKVREMGVAGAEEVLEVEAMVLGEAVDGVMVVVAVGVDGQVVDEVGIESVRRRF